MIRSTGTRIRRAAIVTSIGALVLIGSATGAMASQHGGGSLAPGAEVCTQQQYASFAVRGTGTATGQLPAGGAKFKLKRDGAVVVNTPQRANSVAFDLRSSNGTFYAPGYYSMCATNTGSAPTSVTVSLYTNYEA